MFNADPDFDRLAIPAGIEITEDRRRMRQADAVIFHIPSLEPIFFRRKAKDQIWIAWSMECDLNYSRQRSTRFMSQFDLTMTYHQSADVMASYIPMQLMDRSILPLALNQPQHLCCSFVSGWTDRSGRNRYIKKLAKQMELHQYGRCGNRKIEMDQGPSSKLSTCAQYKFTLAFENAIAPDYVTEKLYDPLLAGSVPVYLGAPNVTEFAPAKGCYINVADFSGPSELATYLLELDQDEQAYAEYLRWRDQPNSAEFSALCARQSTASMEQLFKLLVAL